MDTSGRERNAVLKAAMAGALADSDPWHLKQVIEQSGESIVVKDLDGVVTVWNRQAAALYGFTDEEAIGRTLRQLHAAALSDEEWASVLTRIRAGVPATKTVQRRRKNGEQLLILNKTTPLFDLEGRLIGEITIARDVTAAVRTEAALRESNVKLQAANAELQKRAFIDSLTGMPNRVLLEDRLAHAAARLDRSRAGNEAQAGEKIAVLFLDLDGFKLINDSFGHAVGDQVLIEVAQRLSAAVRTSDTVARLGGDEFVLLLEAVGDQNDWLSLVHRLLHSLSEPLAIAGQQIEIFASVGVALYPDHGERDQLVAHADAAMYAAKKAGRGSFSLFEPHMDADARERLMLQNDLRHALERRELRLHYQPKIVGGSRGVKERITGVEALLRWNHPKRGVIGPAIFIPIAERVGLIRSLGDWVIDEACRQVRVWADAGLRIPVAINLSVHQLRDPNLLIRIRRSLECHRVDPSQLLCEITESAAMADVDATQRVFEQMRQIGVFLSIDDFGTGYSSLSYLRQLPARQLKIDRTFVTDLESNTDARAVVHAVINLAHALDLRVVAEGVETEGQRNILSSLECDELQGYLFAQPMPAEALQAWISERQSRDGSIDPPQEAAAV
ncbi:MAG: EAL domain-containing protein [Burkholderiaceae bacterium]|nr:EAL domain-containing protein [Burkholderiaceae bacterium]